MKKSFTFTKKDFILLIILSLTILVVDYSLRWYSVYKEHNLNKSVISKYIVEITPNDFDNYIAENRDTFVYMGIAGNKECKTFENIFKKVVKKYNLRDEIVYLNVEDTDLTSVISKYIDDELRENTLLKIPVIVVYNNSKIVEFINYDNSDMKEKAIVNLFRKYGVIEYND